MVTRTEELEKLLDVVSLIVANLDMESVLTSVLQAATQLMDAEASNVMLLDKEKNELSYQVVLGEAGNKIKGEKRIAVGTGIAGWVAEHRKALLVKDAYQDPRFFPEFDRKTGFKTKSIVCVPLESKGEIIGVAQIINKKNKDAFTERDLSLFTQFCGMAALSIDNALLHQSRLREERMSRDLKLAEEVQRTFLPRSIPMVENLRIDYRVLPCRHVAGDFIAIDSIKNGKVAVIVADVSGKGAAAALFGARVSRDYTHLLKYAEGETALFSDLNDLVSDASSKGMFVTAVFVTFDPVSGRGKIINAGHLKPALVSSNGIKQLEIEPDLPLGILSGTTYKAHDFELKDGESIVFITDGVTDARSEKGDQIGEARTLEALGHNVRFPVSGLVRTLLDWSGTKERADDISVVSLTKGRIHQYELPSSPSELGPARKILTTFCAPLRLDEKSLGRLELVLSEALGNVMKHTYGGREDGKIRVSLESYPDHLAIRIRDWGPKQDATKIRPKKRDPDDLEPGGLGVAYMMEIMDVVQFDQTHTDGNELHLIWTFK